MGDDSADTQGRAYTETLIRESGRPWKRLLRVQAPYGWNARRLARGLTLDVGCGIGKNLGHLRGRAVGVDHNQSSVAECRRRGFEAYTPEEFLASHRAVPGAFGTLLLSHVVEHLKFAEAVSLLKLYLPFLGSSGLIVLFTPQEAGFMSDPTHLEFMDFKRCARLLTEVGCSIDRQYSFPFPRVAGTVFLYNEFVTVGRRGGRG